MPRYLPFMINVEDKNVLVVGGGRIAYRKAKLFLENKANVTVIAKELCNLFKNSSANIINEDVTKVKDLESYVSDSLIVVAATENKEINDYVERLCLSYGKLCNVVDRSGTHLIFPAFFKSGDVIVSVSTSGNVPYFSAFLRDMAKAELSRYIRGYSAVKRLRKKLMEKDPDLRLSILKEITRNEKFWESVKANDKVEMDRIVSNLIKKIYKP